MKGELQMENETRKGPAAKAIICKRVNEHKVFPGTIHVKPGDEISWRAPDFDVKFFFPYKELFGKNLFEFAAGDPIFLKVSEKLPENDFCDVFPYAIFCAGKEANTFAIGNSEPIIIIER